MIPSALYHRVLAVVVLMTPLLITSSGAQGLLGRGDAALYVRRIGVESTMTYGTTTRRIFNDDSAQITFTVDSVAANALHWIRIDRGESLIGMRMEDGGRNGVQRMRLDRGPTRFVTDTVGEPIDEMAKTLLGGIARVNGGVESKVVPAFWFLPAKLRRAVMGTKLVRTYADEIPVDEGHVGIYSPTRISYVIELRHAGTVDTLGRRAVRIAWKVDDLHYTNTMQTSKDGEEGEMVFTSDGASSGIAYYSAIDGMLLSMQGKGELLMTGIPDDDEEKKMETRSEVRFSIEGGRSRESGVGSRGE